MPEIVGTKQVDTAAKEEVMSDFVVEAAFVAEVAVAVVVVEEAISFGTTSFHMDLPTNIMEHLTLGEVQEVIILPTNPCLSA